MDPEQHEQLGAMMAQIDDATTAARASSSKANGTIRRRNRLPLSCDPCRIRKLKCDRQKPCENCKVRDSVVYCVYARDADRTNRDGPLLSLSLDMGDRVRKLEGLVNSMLTAQQASAVASIPAQSAVQAGPISTVSNMTTNGVETNDFPNVDMELGETGPYAAMAGANDEQQFFGPSHWEAVLRDITAIRLSIEESAYKLKVPLVVDNDRPAIVRGVPPIASKAGLIQTLPTKSLADRLLARYWEFQDPSMPLILHTTTFNAHFNATYEDFETASFSTLAILFTIFSMALHTYETNGPEPRDLRGYIPDLANSYRQSAASCIWAADIALPSPDLVTAFQLYWVCEFQRCPKALSSLWMIQSMLIRKAISVGYHRDPKQFPWISVFKAEMRRRSWHAMCQSDLLLSFHLGLPPMIDYAHSDVTAPRSLYEDDLHEGMTELPTERPKTEKTPISYSISKMKIFQVFGEIIRVINNISQPNDDEIANLNTKLTSAYEDIHPHLREETMDETEIQRFQRYGLANVYHKAICVLNRRSLFINNRSSIQEQSRELCIKSALTLLSIQDSMSQHDKKWYERVYNRNDYLLATALVCMMLYTHKKYARSDSNNMFDLPLEAEESTYRSNLARARVIWSELLELVPESRKALQIIDATLHQTDKQKSPMGEDSVESAVYSALSTESVNTPDFFPIYPSMDFEKIDWSSWDKTIQSSIIETAPVPTDHMSQADFFNSLGV